MVMMRWLFAFIIASSFATLVLSFPVPQVQFSAEPTKLALSNTLTKSINSWTDCQGGIYTQPDLAQQPNLFSIRKNKNAVSFIPKSLFQTKSLTGPFVIRSSKIQLVTLLSLFTRCDNKATTPWTFFSGTKSMTLQYEYDTKCFGFYWNNRGVKLCGNYVNSVDLGGFNATLIFASIEENVISLQIGDKAIRSRLMEDFDSFEGQLVLGDSPFIFSPFYGVLHTLEVYNDILSDYEKFSLNLQYSGEHQLPSGAWNYWSYDAKYDKDFAYLMRYSDQAVREATSSQQFRITDITALNSTADVPSSLCVAHNLANPPQWEQKSEFGQMDVLNRHWKLRYVPGSGGYGTVKITVKDLPPIDNTTITRLTICYKEKQLDKCSLYSATSSDTFILVPRTGFYYLVLALGCSVKSDCASFVKPENVQCEFECHQYTCSCNPEGVVGIEPQANVGIQPEADVSLEPKADELVEYPTEYSMLSTWTIYPLAMLVSVALLAIIMGIRQWLRARRTVERVV